MKKFVFFKFSPSGNTTLFLLGNCHDAHIRSRICREALGAGGIQAEQVAFADPDKKTVEMAAGEFCANACRAFGALLDLRGKFSDSAGERSYQMRITGSDNPVELIVTGHEPHWRVQASFALDQVALERIESNSVLINLPGIYHLLLETDEFPAFAEAGEKAAILREQLNIGNSASGIVWWRKSGDNYQIFPWVHVPDVGTSMLESSCGSASIALALRLFHAGGKNLFKIRQPSGEYLEASLNETGYASLSGNVSLCANGNLWLNG